MSSSNDHPFVAPTADASRSPCPALNALANHGYLPHDGKNLTVFQLTSAIHNVYKLSYPLAFGLSAGGIVLCGHGIVLDLDGLRQHNRIEHDASMAHRDVDETKTALAADKPDSELVQAMIKTSKDGKNLTVEDLIQYKAGREQRAGLDNAYHKAYPNAFLSLLSHGEIALANQALKRGDLGIPIESAHTWFFDERLPDDFNPEQTLGLIEIYGESTSIAKKTEYVHSQAAEARRNV